MKQLTINYSNGNSTTYNLVQGEKDMPIAYNEVTNEKLIKAIERARTNKTRVRIYLGDIKSGKCWNEENDIFGYIGLSKGKQAYYPILVHNTRSFGGGNLGESCIIKMVESSTKRVLYVADNFTQSTFEVKPSTQDGYTHSVYIDGELYSNHKTEKQAKRLIKLLS